MSGRTLLGVWAHPDDEAYLSAGLMMQFRANGDRVVVVTATAGELGTSDPQQWPPERLARHRRRELRASLAALGVGEVRFLGFADGACAASDGTWLVADHIADIEPDVIVTFGPDGMTGHPDHLAVSRWTTDAWATTRPATDLWYATVTPEFHAQWGPVNDRIGLFADQPAPPCTERDALAHSLTLTDRELDRKIAALRAHASQTVPLVELMGADDYREWWRTESFRAALRPDADDSTRTREVGAARV